MQSSSRIISCNKSVPVEVPWPEKSDLQYWSNEHRDPLRKLLKSGVWSLPIETGQKLGIPQADVNDPKPERVKRDFESRPTLPKSDFRKSRLTLLDILLEGGKDLFVVVRFTLRGGK